MHKIAEIRVQDSVYLHLPWICLGARGQQEILNTMLLPECPSHYLCIQLEVLHVQAFFQKLKFAPSDIIKG